MRVIVTLALCLPIVLSACAEAPVPEVRYEPLTMPDFSAPTAGVDTPHALRTQVELEREFPPLAPADKASQIAEGERILREELRLAPQVFASMKEREYALIDGSGRHALLTLRLEPSSGGATFRSIVSRPAAETRHVLKLDNELRLLHQEIRYRNEGAPEQITVARFSERDGQFGYVVTSRDRDEQFVATEKAVFPEEALVLVPELLRLRSLQANIPIFSTKSAGVYGALIRVRLAHDDPSRALMTALAVSPFGEKLSAIVSDSGERVREVSWSEGAAQWAPATPCDVVRLQRIGALADRERGALLFDERTLYSAWSVSGRHLGVLNDVEKIEDQRWFGLVTMPLNLTVATRTSLRRNDLVALADNESAASGALSSLRFSAGAARVSLRPNARQLDISIDFKPSGMSLSDYARIVEAQAQKALDVSRIRRKDYTLHGVACVRLDAEITSPRGATTAFRSTVLAQHGNSLIRLEFSAGQEYDTWLEAWGEVCSSLHLREPQLGDVAAGGR